MSFVTLACWGAISMSLKGTLKDLHLADLFQIAQQHRRTGVLRVRNAHRRGFVIFSDGNIVEAGLMEKTPEARLGALAVRSRLISAADLERALEQQHVEGGRLGQILTRKYAVEEERLRRILQVQLTDALFEMCTWEDGQYELHRETPDYNDDLATPQNPAHLLMDVFRMIDEWPAIKRRLGGLNAVPVIVQGSEDLVVKNDSVDASYDQAAGGVATAPLRRVEAGRVALNAAETIVWEFIDGERTVREIVDLTVLGRFETCKAIAQLRESQFVTIIQYKDAEVVPEDPPVASETTSAGGGSSSDTPGGTNVEAGARSHASLWSLGIVIGVVALVVSAVVWAWAFFGNW